MGSSAKRKKEKKKDFQKQKLKVGKTKPKAANFTDTSFTSKSISLKKQFANDTAAPSSQVQIAHHVSRLRNRTESLRLESLAYLTNLPTTELNSNAQDILPKLPGLIHDLSPAVRGQLLKLFKRFSSDRVELQHELLLTWTRAGITHLSKDIRLFALDVLEWLVSVAGSDVVSCKGGWIVTLRSFLTTLGWRQATNTEGWSSYQTTNARVGTETKAQAKLLNALAVFIRAGLAPPDSEAVATAVASDIGTFPLIHIREHVAYERHNPFAHLNLFGQVRDDRDVMLEDREDRQDAFEKEFLYDINKGVEEAKKQGGEVGRASAALRKAIDIGMV